MKCIQCGCELGEGAKFCFQCGAKQPEESIAEEVFEEEIPVEEEPAEEEPEEVFEETPVYEEDTTQEETYYEEEEVFQGDKLFCPYCGAQNEADAVFCCSCGQNMSEGGDTGLEVVDKPKKGKKIVLAVAGVAAIAVVGVFAFKFIGGLGDKDKANYMAYIKDKNLMQIDMDSRKKMPLELERNASERDGRVSAAYIQYSKDGKYVCYASDFDEYSYRLNVRRADKKKAESVRIDNNVQDYKLADDNMIYYVNDDGTLYRSDLKGNSEKIASDVENFVLSKDCKEILWTEDGDDGYDLYHRETNLKKDEQKIAKDIRTKYVSKDFKKIVVWQDDELIQIINLKDEKKIASDVYSIVNIDVENERYYYTKEEERDIAASDIVEDDCKAEDAKVKEPKEEDFQEEVIKKTWTGKYEKVKETNWDKYYEARDEYYEVESREEIREELDTYEFTSTVEDLYCSTEKDEKLVQENYSYLVSVSNAEKNKGFVYVASNAEKMGKIKLSELDYVGDLEYRYENMLSDCQTTYVAKDGKEMLALEERASDGIFDDDGAIYVTTEVETKKSVNRDEDEDEDEYEDDYDYEMSYRTDLIRLTVEKDKVGSEVVEEDIESLEMAKDGKVYYIAEMSKKGNKGELFCNGENIDSDVTPNSVHAVKDSDAVIYTADISSDGDSAALKMYDGKKAKEVADDVYQYYVMGEKEIAVLVDYSTKRYEGELKLYVGKDQLKDLDSDVQWIIGGRTVY